MAFGTGPTLMIDLAHGQVGEDGLVPPPARPPAVTNGRSPWLAARRQDARWAREYAGPWLRRRVGGTSSGDGVRPKRPDLLPL